MAKTRQNKKYRRGKTRRLIKRGGGGCFGGLCSSNKSVNAERPGAPPKNNTKVYTNPLGVTTQNRVTSILSRPLNISGMPTNEEALAELNALEQRNTATTSSLAWMGSNPQGIKGTRPVVSKKTANIIQVLNEGKAKKLETIKKLGAAAKAAHNRGNTQKVKELMTLRKTLQNSL